MKYISVPSAKVPALGFGTWELQGKECVAAVQAALDTGYRHLDTAQIYQNEAEVGTAIRQSGVPRGDIFLTTKIWRDVMDRDSVRPSLQQSLDKLQTEYVDLLLIHWPSATVPFEETLVAMQACQKDGLVRHLGVSNFTVAQMQDVVNVKGFGALVTNQVEYHPMLSQEGILKFLRAQDMFLTAYCPLARGALGGNETLLRIAKTYGKSVGQVALNWLVGQDRVAAIPKSSHPERIRENFDIFDFELSPADRAAIDALRAPQGRLVNPAWAPMWDAA